MNTANAITAAAAIAAAAAAAHAQFDQDYSSDINNPTPLGTFQPGSTTVSGFVIDALGSNSDIDVFTFDLAAGTQLTSILYTADNANRPFVAIDAGSVFSQDPNALNNPSEATFLGGAVVNEGTDILPLLAQPASAGTGFTTPLDPGTYSFFIQQIGNNPTNYTLDFNVVPTPASAALLAIPAATALRRRR